MEGFDNGKKKWIVVGIAVAVVILVIVILVVYYSNKNSGKSGFLGFGDSEEMARANALNLAMSGANLGDYPRNYKTPYYIDPKANAEQHYYDPRQAYMKAGHYGIEDLRNTPESQLTEEQELWVNGLEEDGIAVYDPVKGASPGTDFDQYHTRGPAHDYEDYVIDRVSSPEMRARQLTYAQELQPWSGVARSYDTLELANYAPRIGIRAFGMGLDAPAVSHNALFVNELGPIEMASSKGTPMRI